jgi:hypothetical protein
MVDGYAINHPPCYTLSFTACSLGIVFRIDAQLVGDGHKNVFKGYEYQV